MNPYPALQNDSNASLKSALDYIARERIQDTSEWNALPGRFVGGRRVAKVPTSSSDTTGSAAGDFNVTASFAYFCIQSGATLEWVRAAVGTF